MKVPKETSRRSRSLDFSVMKGQEFRNIATVFFPVVLKCIEHNAKERKVWLLFAFVIRSCIIPNDEFDNVDKNLIHSSSLEFYELYEALFGIVNCTYYTHSVFSHLLRIRGSNPLTHNSAFGFESFYGELRHSFVPGTGAPLKQIMKKVMLKRIIGSHCCSSSIYYSHKNTQKECNNLIYRYSNDKYNIYKIINKSEETLTCQNIKTKEKIFEETPTLKWSKVGVLEDSNEIGDTVEFQTNTIHGKVVKIDDLLLTFPNNLLRET